MASDRIFNGDRGCADHLYFQSVFPRLYHRIQGCALSYAIPNHDPNPHNHPTAPHRNRYHYSHSSSNGYHHLYSHANPFFHPYAYPHADSHFHTHWHTHTYPDYRYYSTYAARGRRWEDRLCLGSLW